jgi:hypothetical protein
VLRLTSLFPLVTAAAALLLPETPAAALTPTTQPTPPPQTANGAADSAAACGQQHDSKDCSSNSVTRSSGTGGAAVEVGSVGLAGAARAQAALLLDFLRRPHTAAPLTFLLAACATPSASSAMFYFQTEALHFSAAFQGQVRKCVRLRLFVCVCTHTNRGYLSCQSCAHCCASHCNSR